MLVSFRCGIIAVAAFADVLVVAELTILMVSLVLS